MADQKSTSSTVKQPSLAILIAISAINPLAINIYLPSLPKLVDVFGTTMSMVQLTLSLYLVGVALAQIIIGPLSDRYGRRPVLLWGMVIFVIGSAVCAVAPTIDVFIYGRILQAAGGCSGIVLGRAIVRDVHARERAASMIGYVTMGMAVAPMIGPAIGGVLDEMFGWVATFQLLTILGVLVLIAAYVNLHETHFSRGSAGFSGLLSSFSLLLTMPAFWCYALTAAFTSSVYFAFLGGAPHVADALLSLRASEYGLYFILVAAGYMVGNWATGRFAARVGVGRMILIGNCILLAAIGGMIAAFSAGYLHPLSLFGPMFFVGAGNGLSLPSAVAGAVSVRPDLAGAAAGLSGSLQIGAGAAASAIAGWLLSGILWPGTVWSLVLVMVVAASLSLLVGLAAFVVEKRN